MLGEEKSTPSRVVRTYLKRQKRRTHETFVSRLLIPTLKDRCIAACRLLRRAYTIRQIVDRQAWISSDREKCHRER